MTASYSAEFLERQKPEEYDLLYQPGMADQIVWQIEQRWLREIVNRMDGTSRRLDHLDFACGTGRVISFLEPLVASSLGIDISPEMVRVASTRVLRSQIRCEDITQSEIEKYDLITAFRFFLNAEPELRRRVMSALAARLRDTTSMLVFTNHGNPFSYKAVLWPFHRLRQFLAGRRRKGNYLTHKEVQTLVDEVELEIVQRVGMGFITPKAVRFAPRISARCEDSLASSHVLGRFGVNQLYVAKLKARAVGSIGVS